MKLGRDLVRGAERLGLRRNAPDLFADGDVLFIPGASWDDLGAFDALVRIKQTRRLAVVPIVYDVIPARLPQACEPLLVQLFAPWIRKLLTLSDLILTISRWSRRDLIALAEELGVAAPPVEVIRLGDTPAGFNRPARPANLPPGVGTFALSVGTFEVRKNHWLLYHVWRRLIETHGDRVPPLVLAGRMGWATKDVRQLIQADPMARDRILVLFDATDEELSWLYAHCLFTLYPSHYEGWACPWRRVWRTASTASARTPRLCRRSAAPGWTTTIRSTGRGASSWWGACCSSRAIGRGARPASARSSAARRGATAPPGSSR